LDVNEELVKQVDLNVLSSRQYCVVLNPVGENGKNRWGIKELRKGEKSFFLQPGESLEKGIQNIYVLNEHQNLLVRAIEVYEDKNGKYKPGESFVVKGPCEFIPPINVEILQERKNIQLSHNEGIYVQRKDTGQVRLVQGPQAYCLEPTEEFWEKQLDP